MGLGWPGKPQANQSSQVKKAPSYRKGEEKGRTGKGRGSRIRRGGGRKEEERTGELAEGGMLKEGKMCDSHGDDEAEGKRFAIRASGCSQGTVGTVWR